MHQKLLLMMSVSVSGGKSIQQECDTHVRLNGSLLDGQSFLSGAGKLPCKKIIHAVGPTWRGGRQGEEDILYDCVYANVLTLARMEHLSTVAIPAISAGVFGFPVDKSAVCIVDAIRDFATDNAGRGSLTEVSL